MSSLSRNKAILIIIQARCQFTYMKNWVLSAKMAIILVFNASKMASFEWPLLRMLEVQYESFAPFKLKPGNSNIGFGNIIVTLQSQMSSQLESKKVEVRYQEGYIVELSRCSIQTLPSLNLLKVHSLQDIIKVEFADRVPRIKLTKNVQHIASQICCVAM